MNNLIMLSRLMQINNDFRKLSLSGGTLQLQDRKINISNINLEDIVKRHNVLENKSMSAEEFFNICAFCSNNVIALFQLIDLNPEYNRLNIEENYLILGERKLDIKNFCIGDTIEKNGLLDKISSIPVEQFFDICLLYANKNYIKSNESVVYGALNNDSKDKAQIVTIFNNYIFKIMELEKYVDEDITGIKQRFSNYIAELQINPDKLNSAQKAEIELYNNKLGLANSLEKKEEKTLTRTLTTNKITANGYINILLISILTIVVGITIGAIIFLKFHQF